MSKENGVRFGYFDNETNQSKDFTTLKLNEIHMMWNKASATKIISLLRI